jgi:hypothetical protein
VDPSARVGDTKQSKKLGLFDLVSHVSVEIRRENLLVQRQKNVFVEGARVINGVGVSQQVKFNFAVITEVGMQPQSVYQRTMAEAFAKSNLFPFHQILVQENLLQEQIRISNIEIRNKFESPKSQ